MNTQWAEGMAAWDEGGCNVRHNETYTAQHDMGAMVLGERHSFGIDMATNAVASV